MEVFELRVELLGLDQQDPHAAAARSDWVR